MATSNVTPSTTGAGASAGTSTGSAAPTSGAGSGAGAASTVGNFSGSVDTPSTVPETVHQPDGQSGAGAMDSTASVDAMLAALNAKTGVTPPAVDGEQKPAAEQTATTEKPAEGEAKPAELVPADGEEDGYSFEEDGVLGARDMAAKLDLEAPNLSEETRNVILSNSRLAEAGHAYKKLFSSPKEAEVIKEAAQDFTHVQNVFASIRGEKIGEASQSLVNLMMEMTAKRDADGKILRNSQGLMLTDGTTGRFLKHMVGARLGNLEKQFKDAGDQQATDAINLVMERAGLRPSTAAKTEVDPALAAQKAELDARESRINQETQARTETEAKNYREGLSTDLSTLNNTEIDKLFSHATGVVDGLTKKAVVQSVKDEIAKRVRASTAYQREKGIIRNKPLSAARRVEEVGLAKRFLRENLVEIARPFFQEAGITIQKKQASKAAAQSARADIARSDVAGAVAKGPTAVPSGRDADPQALRTQFADALKKTLGRDPSDSEVNVEMMLAAAQRKAS